MKSVVNTRNNWETIQKLHVIAIKITEIAVRSETLLQSAAAPVVAEGLIAVGLCKQAKEQIASACQNLGFSVETLPQMMNKSAELENMLTSARQGVSTLIERKFNVSKSAVTSGIEGFVGEMLMVAAIMVARAEEHVRTGEQFPA